MIAIINIPSRGSSFSWKDNIYIYFGEREWWGYLNGLVLPKKKKEKKEDPVHQKKKKKKKIV